MRSRRAAVSDSDAESPAQKDPSSDETEEDRPPSRSRKAASKKPKYVDSVSDKFLLQSTAFTSDDEKCKDDVRVFLTFVG